MRSIRCPSQLKLLLTSNWWISRRCFRLLLFIFIDILVLILICFCIYVHAWRELLSIYIYLFGQTVEILHVCLLARQTSWYIHHVSVLSPYLSTILFSIYFSVFHVFLVRERIFIISLMHLLSITQIHGGQVWIHLVLSIIIRINLFQIGLPFIDVWIIDATFSIHGPLFRSKRILLWNLWILLVRHILLDHGVVMRLSFRSSRLRELSIRVILIIRRHYSLLGMIIWLRFHL